MPAHKREGTRVQQQPLPHLIQNQTLAPTVATPVYQCVDLKTYQIVPAENGKADSFSIRILNQTFPLNGYTNIPLEQLQLTQK